MAVRICSLDAAAANSSSQRVRTGYDPYRNSKHRQSARLWTAAYFCCENVKVDPVGTGSGRCGEFCRRLFVGQGPEVATPVPEMDARPRRLVSARSAALPGLHQFRLAETVSALVEETNRRISLKRAFGILQSDPRVHAKTKAGPHPDPLPSDGNSQVCLSHFPTRLDTPTDRRRFSLSHPPCRASDARLAPELHVAAGRMGEGRGEGTQTNSV